MYCIINSEELIKYSGFESVEFSSILSQSGDVCHLDIIGASDKDCRKFVMSFYKNPNVFLCCEGNSNGMTVQNIENLIEFISQCNDENNNEYFN
jgi:hypothetical protein